MANDIALLALILCAVHLIGSLGMSIMTVDNSRFAALYTGFTALILAGIVGSLFFLPQDMGFGGMVFLYFPIIPIVFTTPFVLIVRVISRVIG